MAAEASRRRREQAAAQRETIERMAAKHAEERATRKAEEEWEAKLYIYMIAPVCIVSYSSTTYRATVPAGVPTYLQLYPVCMYMYELVRHSLIEH